MPLNQSIFTFSLPILAVVLTSELASAVTLTYGDTYGDGVNISYANVKYVIANKEGEVFVRYPPRIMPKGGTPVLRHILNEQLPDWTFYSDFLLSETSRLIY
jgi:hypothetical protein